MQTDIRVEDIRIYPLKGGAATSLERVSIQAKSSDQFSGINGDRQFILVDIRGDFISQRTVPKLALISIAKMETEIIEVVLGPDKQIKDKFRYGDQIKVKVHFRWTCGIKIGGPINDYISDFLGLPVVLVEQNESTGSKGFFDAHPIHLISRDSVRNLNRYQPLGESKISAERFRYNILMTGLKPFEEDDFIGKTLAIGSEAKIKIASVTRRCIVTHVNPLTGKRDTDTLKLMSRAGRKKLFFVGPKFGIYGVPTNSGVVCREDIITVLPSPDGER